MHLTILNTDAKTFFQNAKDLESSCPTGHWRHFRFLKSDNVIALFETEQATKTSIPLHENFFKYFLGTFSPGLEQTLDIHQMEDFQSFCLKLNSLLENKIEIFDLSVSKYWIWSKGSGNQIPKKLFSFLEFN